MRAINTRLMQNSQVARFNCPAFHPIDAHIAITAK